MMLAAVTGYADALWRPSAWYLTILEDLQPKAGQAKMEKTEKFLVKMEKFPVKKFPFSCDIKAATPTYVACLPAEQLVHPEAS